MFPKLNDLRFLWAFGKARTSEISGDYASAIRRLNSAQATRRYQGLRDAYWARLVALSEGPSAGLEAVATLAGKEWFITPANDAELYTKVYVEYLVHALRGHALERDHNKAVLNGIQVDSMYRSALRVT
jgi:hypothetical protein